MSQLRFINYNSQSLLLQYNGTEVVNALLINNLQFNNKLQLRKTIKYLASIPDVKNEIRLWSKKNYINRRLIQKLNNDTFLLKKLNQANSRIDLQNRQNRYLTMNKAKQYLPTKNTDILTKIKSPYSNIEFDIVFRPSKYLDLENNIWILISIIGEDAFIKALTNHNSIIDSQFVLTSLRNSNQYYYISKQKKKIFSYTNERIKIYYPDVSKLKITSLLKYLDLPKIEELIEKGEINYELTRNS
jgi:hypothetical protein